MHKISADSKLLILALSICFQICQCLKQWVFGSTYIEVVNYLQMKQQVQEMMVQKKVRINLIF
jgi:hypothetical protein